MSVCLLLCHHCPPCVEKRSVLGVALVLPWWCPCGALVVPWWCPGGALVVPWWCPGGALVAPCVEKRSTPVPPYSVPAGEGMMI